MLFASIRPSFSKMIFFFLSSPTHHHHPPQPPNRPLPIFWVLGRGEGKGKGEGGGAKGREKKNELYATSTKIMTCRRSTLTTRDNELCKDSYWAVRDIARDLSALSEMHTRMRGVGRRNECDLRCGVLATACRVDVCTGRRCGREPVASVFNGSYAFPRQ